jgi:hypothetical protein
MKWNILSWAWRYCITKNNQVHLHYLNEGNACVDWILGVLHCWIKWDENSLLGVKVLHYNKFVVLMH